MEIVRLGMEIKGVPGVDLLRVDGSQVTIRTFGSETANAYDAAGLAELITALQLAHRELTGGIIPESQPVWATLDDVPAEVGVVLDKDGDKSYRDIDGTWDIGITPAEHSERYGPFRAVAYA